MRVTTWPLRLETGAISAIHTIRSAFGLAVAADLEQRAQTVVEGFLAVRDLPGSQQCFQLLIGCSDRGMRFRSTLPQSPHPSHRSDETGLEALARATGAGNQVRRDV